MSDKTTPVWLHHDNGTATQIGVASEVDPETNARVIDIWDQFKSEKLEKITISGSEPSAKKSVEATPARESRQKQEVTNER